MEEQSRTPVNRVFGLLAIAAAMLGGYGAIRALRSVRRSPEPQQGARRPRVLILGAGFAGLEVARSLHRSMPGRCEIMLLDRHNYQLFTPLLFQVAACGVDPYSITYPVRQFTEQKGATFRTAIVSGIDLDRRRVRLQDLGEVGYDYLVIALGSTTNYFGIQSAQEHALPLKTVGDGIAIRNHVLGVLERSGHATDQDEKKKLLTFVIVGGGSTGVETAAALSEFLQDTVPASYPDVAPSDPRIVVIEGSGKLLGHMKSSAADLALSRLKEMGVEVWLDTRAKDVHPDELVTEDGRTVSARTIIWATGVKAPDVVASVNADHGEGGSLAADQYLQVKGHPGAYAIGDCAAVTDSITHKQVPWLAASAQQEARAVARNIVRSVQGKPQVQFQYRSSGTLVSLGRNSGIAQFGRLVIDGLIGTILWHVVHLAKIPTMRERISTMLDWSAGYVHDNDTARVEAWPMPAAKPHE